MAVVQCPACNEEVSVPAGASPEAQVRCPLCQEQYVLSSALEGLPPELEVVSDPSAGEGDDAYAAYQSPTSVFESSPLGDSAAPAFELTSSAPAGGEATASPAKPRRRRKQKNMAFEMVKIVGGGVIGLSLAMVILWWLPFGWDRDPFDLGPKVAAYVPFIVPEKRRGMESVDTATEDDPPFSPINGANGGGSDSDATNTGQANNTDTSEGGGEDTLEPEDDFPGGGAFPTGSTNDDTGEPKRTFLGQRERDTTPNPIENGRPNENDTTPAVVAKFNGPVSFRDPETFTVEDLQEAKTNMYKAAVAWANPWKQEPPVKTAPELERDLYGQLAALGQAITFADRSSAQVQTEMGEIDSKMQRFVNKPEQVRLIAKGLGGWRAPAARTNRGIVAVGTVIASSAPTATLEIEGAVNERMTFVWLGDNAPPAKGDRVLVLGVISDNPRFQLQGYEGDGSEVYCAGQTVRLGGAPTSVTPRPAENTGQPDLPTIPVPSLDLPSVELPSLDLPTPKPPTNP